MGQPVPRPQQRREKRSTLREEKALASHAQDKEDRDDAKLKEEEEIEERAERGRVIETETGTRAMLGAMVRFLRGNASASRK